MSRYSDSLRVINKHVDKRALRQVIDKFRTLATTAVICSTEAATQIKSASLDGFCLTTGACLRVLFTNENTADAPQLQINSEQAKAIKVIHAGSKVAIKRQEGMWRGANSYTNETWQPNTILELMYDGTDFIIMGNPIVEDYHGTDQSYIVYANGLIKQSIISTVLTNYFLVKYNENPVVSFSFDAASTFSQAISLAPVMDLCSMTATKEKVELRSTWNNSSFITQATRKFYINVSGY